jgi:hypothetical protein
LFAHALFAQDFSVAENNHLICKFDSAGSHDILEDACPSGN